LSNQSVQFAKSCLIVAGILLMLETMLGCIYMLGIGFSSTRDIAMILCLTMALPVYLIRFFSLRGAAISLWAFFAIQWITVCTIDKPHFVNPFGWAHGNLSFVGAVLVSLSTWMLSRIDDHKKSAHA
jgi:hypothetical protein